MSSPISQNDTDLAVLPKYLPQKQGNRWFFRHFFQSLGKKLGKAPEIGTQISFFPVFPIA